MRRLLFFIVFSALVVGGLLQWRLAVREERRLWLEAQKPVEVSVTIPEGFTLEQIGERLLASGFLFTKGDWEREVGIRAWRSGDRVVARRPVGVDLEGYLFPDTYRFYATATPEDIVDMLQRTWSDKVGDPLESARAARGWTWHETLTRASLVQAEVRHEEDMERVAGVIENRLRLGMALQLDSTVHYAVGRQDGDVFTTEDERRVDSPYNTYAVRGLPPGPIDNPGVVAVRAVLLAPKHSFLYFLTDPQGVAHFSETLDEHAANRARYW